MITTAPVLCSGQRKDKLRPHPLGADDIDGLPVALDDLLDDGQSQPGSLLVLASGRIRLVEPFPDLLQALFWDPHACILDRDEGLFIFQRRLDIDDRVRMAELDGIVDQVVEHLLDLSKIRVDHGDGLRERQVQHQVLGVAGALEGGGRILDNPVDVKIGPGQIPFAVQRIEGQKSLGQLVEPVRLGDDPV